MMHNFKQLNAIEWVILAALVVMSTLGALGAAQAADRADEVQAYPPEAYCRYVGGIYFYGVKRHNDGAPAVIKHWVEKAVDPIEPTVDDGLYVRGWNDMSDSEKAFVTTHLLAGWQYAEKLTAGQPKATVSADAAAYVYYKDCLKQKADEVDRQKLDKKTSFIKVGSAPPLSEQQVTEMIMGKPGTSPPLPFVAQSEAMQHPEIVQGQMCQFQIRAGKWTWMMSRFVTKERLWEVNPLPENWSDEIKTSARALVDKAYAHTGTEDAFMKEVAATCGK